MKLEAMMQVFSDIKKAAHFHKHTGTWWWSDRDDETNEHGPFATFLECVSDAVEPYFGQGVRS